MTLYDTPQFSVDSHGAYLTRLTDSKGIPILFERTEIEGKRRGGAHVCLPYFGADAAGVLPQHGFGRDVEWNVEVLDNGAVSCVYEKMEQGNPTGLHARMLYELGETKTSFITALMIANRSGSKESFPATPGFHPYFAVDPRDVRLNGERIDLADFEPFQSFSDTSEMTIESRGRTVTVSSNDLRHIIVWTDQRGGYLCVEPTHSGHSFDSMQPGGVVLQPGDSVSYGYTISWS